MDEYPKDTKEFDKWFPSDNECLNYIIRLRWPNGYQCPHCHVVGQSWLRDRGRIKCKNCRHEQSVTGGTIFHRSHTPLRTWFKIMWNICLQKNGYSAMSLQRSLGFSYPTAWLCLHKLRKAMGQNRKDLLSGEVEVDETYVGGVHKGKRGRGSGGKEIVLVAAERKISKKGNSIIGRIRLVCIPDVTRKTLHDAISLLVAPGATIVTDGWKAYNRLEKLGYEHKIEINGKVEKTPFGEENVILDTSPLPKCHRVISLMKRWILGTLQGSIGKDHIQDYLHEFTFRFNRRNSKARGMLFWRLAQMAVDNEPTTKKEIYANHI